MYRKNRPFYFASGRGAHEDPKVQSLENAPELTVMPFQFFLIPKGASSDVASSSGSQNLSKLSQLIAS